MKAIELFGLMKFRNSFLAALVVTALVGPAAIPSLEARPYDGTVQPLVCDPQQRRAVKSSIEQVPKKFGFGTSSKGILVVNSGDPSASGGCLLPKFRTADVKWFQRMEIIFKAPSGS